MLSSKDGVGQVIKACVTVVTLIALTGRLRVIKAALDHMFRRTRGTLDAIRPAQLTNCLITLHLVDELRDVHLHGWTPVRDRGMGWRQYTPSSHATTLESKKSVDCNGTRPSLVCKRLTPLVMITTAGPASQPSALRIGQHAAGYAGGLRQRPAQHAAAP